MSTLCGNYISEKILGSGTFGEVHLVHRQEQPNLKYALKRSTTKSGSIEPAELIEINILILVDHPNVLSPVDVFLDPTNRVCLILPLAQEDLYKFIKRTPYSSQGPTPEILNYIQSLLAGVDYLHSNGIVHQDLKPQNILLIDDTLKIADFGSSRFFNGEIPFTYPVQTLVYRAPEIAEIDLKVNRYSGYYYYTSAIDIWSTGLIIFQLLTGQLLVDPSGSGPVDLLLEIATHIGPLTPSQEETFLSNAPSKKKLIEQVRRLRLTRPSSKFGTMPVPWRDLIISMIRTDPYQRTDLKTILANPLFSSFDIFPVEEIPFTVYRTEYNYPIDRQEVISKMRQEAKRIPYKHLINDAWFLGVSILDRYTNVVEVTDLDIAAKASLNLAEMLLFGEVTEKRNLNVLLAELDIVNKLSFKLYTKSPISLLVQCTLKYTDPRDISQCLVEY